VSKYDRIVCASWANLDSICSSSAPDIAKDGQLSNFLTAALPSVLETANR
jgi:hypothetical protein